MTDMDLTDAIIPRSDQVNGDDLLTGERTVTITEVRRGSDEQPVNIHLAEFPGRPFKPSKTVLRILVAAWGKESDAYVGRRLTIYRDPDVRFGGQDVGGIRVSAMSHIAKPLKLALTASKGRKTNYVVQPLTEPVKPVASIRPVDPPDGPITAAQLNELGPLLRTNGLTEKETALAYIGAVIDREIGATKEMNKVEAAKVITKLSEPADDELTLPGAES